MTTLAASNITSGFIDLATFDELEKYMYGSSDATVYFVRDTRKSTWFTQVPVVLSKTSGTADFGQDWSVSISRAGDYLLQTWLRATLPVVALSAASAAANPTYRLRWTKNVGHNLIRECNITFNDLVAARFDSYHLDFWSSFTMPAGKFGGYQNMIGNVATLTAPSNTLATSATNVPLNGIPYVLNVPLPLFFSRDSGLALPTAALPYNDMRINFSMRTLSELLCLNNTQAASGTFAVSLSSVTLSPAIPSLSVVNVWANYAIVSNDERRRMGCSPRDILIEQVQTAPKQNFTPAANTAGQSYDIRFSHAIKVLFFAAENVTNAGSVSGDRSNYTTSSVGWTQGATPAVTLPGSSGADWSFDPIQNVSLIYENTSRLSQMGTDYFSLVNPWYSAVSIPNCSGYHCYSYSLNFIAADPMGSTNYGKLTNVSIVPVPSTIAINAASVTGLTSANTPSFPALAVNARPTGADYTQTFQFVLTAVNNNIIRVSGGALGFPVL